MSIFPISQEGTTKLFQSVVIGLMSFIAFHVYQNDISGAVMRKAVGQHETRIGINENRIFDHLTSHPKNMALPIAMPLVHNPKRRGPRIEKAKVI